MITKLEENNFDENIKGGIKLVEFYAPWCGHCKRQEEILKELDKIWIGQVNSDKSPSLVEKHMISGFPTFVLFKDGKEVDRLVGFHSKYEIMDSLMKYLTKK